MEEHTRLRLVRSAIRLAWVTGAVLAVLVAIRLTWGWEASKRMAAAQESAAREKFELDPLKLLPAPIPDQENAAVALLQTFKLQHIEVQDPTRRGDGRFFGFGRFFAQMNAQRILDQLANNQEALASLDRAAKLPQSEWEVNGDGSLRELKSADIFASAFDLQVMLRGAAEVFHARKEDDKAIEFLERLLTVARVMQTEQSLTSKQFASNMKSEAALAFDRWGPDLNWTPAARAAGRRLVGELTASVSDTGDMRRAFQYETATYSETVMRSSPGLASWWIRPLAVDSFARRLVMQKQLLPVVEARNWKDVATLTIDRRGDGPNLENIVQTISMPRYMAADAVRLEFHAKSDGRAVAAMLAALLYEQEKGKYPGSLSELVPAYMAKIPSDPFAQEGRPLRYRVDPGGPTVWSVGENGKDEGGEVAVTGFPMFGNARRFNQPDLVYGAAWRAAAATMPAR